MFGSLFFSPCASKQGGQCCGPNRVFDVLFVEPDVEDRFPTAVNDHLAQEKKVFEKRLPTAITGVTRLFSRVPVWDHYSRGGQAVGHLLS